MKGWRDALLDRALLLKLAARLLAGRLFWILPLLPVLWVAFQVFRLLVEWRTEDFLPADGQTVLIGMPLVVLAIGLGVRVIAGEIDQRTLEIAYTVPGGTHRVWTAKLIAAVAMLAGAEVLAAAATFFFCTSFPLSALYGALQAAVFYLVLAMGLAALTKSEATGALLTTGALILNSFLQGGNVRLSPFWNPANLVDEYDPADVLAWTTQNRIGFLLAIAAIMVLSFARAERREKMLGG
jgi:ABC-type transport system involved in multi-copper enzyme maturation permease subunit